MLGSILTLTFGTISCQLYMPVALYLQGNTLVFISIWGWVDLSATECGQKEQVTSKFLRTLPGIESGTSRLVTQWEFLHMHMSVTT